MNNKIFGLHNTLVVVYKKYMQLYIQKYIKINSISLSKSYANKIARNVYIA